MSSIRRVALALGVIGAGAIAAIGVPGARLAFADTTATARAQPDLLATAKTLVPLLAELRDKVSPHLTVRPGTLPPSPFTGRSSTIVAVQVGRESLDVEPRTLAAMDRLLAWDRTQPLPPEDRALVERWIEELRLALIARMPGPARDSGCDNACVVAELTGAGVLFQGTAAERADARNAVLLDALAAAAE